MTMSLFTNVYLVTDNFLMQLGLCNDKTENER